MTSKLKKLKDLERKLTVSIPVEDYNSKFQTKLIILKEKLNLMVLGKEKFQMMFLNKDMDNLFMLRLLMI